MSMTLKITVPVLEKLVEMDEGFVVQLSHAAAKEIGDKYSSALLQSKIVQEALAKLDNAIVAAQVESGRQLEIKIGQWDNSYNTGYKLRADVVKYIESNFSQIIADRFQKWMESMDFNEKLYKLAERYVAQKVEPFQKNKLASSCEGDRNYLH